MNSTRFKRRAFRYALSLGTDSPVAWRLGKVAGAAPFARIRLADTPRTETVREPRTDPSTMESETSRIVRPAAATEVA